MPLKTTVITVCYNSADTIQDTIESVLCQDHKNLEYIIVDGSSTDGTKEIIRSYENKIDKIICEPDKGIYDAMNKGLRHATGDLIGTLNSDDTYIDSNVVQRLSQQLVAQNVDTVFADLLVVDPTDTNQIKRYYNSGSFKPSRLRFGWMPAHPTLFVRRSVYTKCGEYALNYKIASDFEMIIRMYHKHDSSYAYLSEPVVRMRAGGVSTAGVQSSLQLNSEIVQACRHHGLRSNLPLLLAKGPAKLMEIVRGRTYSGTDN